MVIGFYTENLPNSAAYYGILLGKGGLVRAYAQGAKLALEAAQLAAGKIAQQTLLNYL